MQFSRTVVWERQKMENKMRRLVLVTAWWKWGGEGNGWVVDEDESEFDFPDYDGSDAQWIEIELPENAKIKIHQPNVEKSQKRRWGDDSNL